MGPIGSVLYSIPSTASIYNSLALLIDAIAREASQTLGAINAILSLQDASFQISSNPRSILYSSKVGF